MSAPGYSSVGSSVNGSTQSYPSMYQPAGYYGAPPPQSYPGKTPLSSSQPPHYHNSHISPQSHHGAPSTPPSTAPPPQAYAPPPSVQYSQQVLQPQHSPYGAPGSYYEHQSYSAPPPVHHPPAPQQYPLTPSPANAAGTYPSAPGGTQYGPPAHPQSSLGGGLPVQMSAPLHQYSPAQPPCGQTALNGQPQSTASSQQSSYESYSRVDGSGHTPSSTGTPSASIVPSPGHHSAPQSQYGGYEGTSGPSEPEQSPSSSDDEDLEDDDEEAGGDTSSSSTGTASPVHNSFDSLEGGNYPETQTPCSELTPHGQPYTGYGFPGMPPPSSAPQHGYNHSGYPQPSQSFPSLSQLSAALGGLSGIPELEVEALQPINLLQERNLLPPRPLGAPEPNLSQELKKVNCSPETFRCTLTSIPQTQALLNKARLPLGLLLHPFRDLQHLPVITSNTIVRCRSCRTYINPFVTFLDQRRWKCNLCYRINDVPDEFMYNPVTRAYGEPHRRPEVQNSTVEFIASSDYMLRPPQPAVYLFVLDVSHNAVEAGYLKYFCDCLLENLHSLPGDARTRVGFLTFDSTIHFYNLQDGLSQPQMLVVSDIDDVFIPSHDNLMVSLKESKELVKELLSSLPSMFAHTRETRSALGPALQAAFKLMTPTGGRVSVFHTQLPTLGPGLLQSREDPNQRSSTKVVQHLGPATDFYKKLALDCSGQQIGVDLFLLSSQYSDLSSLACMSKYSAGSVYYYPSFHHIHNPSQLEKFQGDLERYLTRKIGFEAVMRIRCTKGLSIHTFHGNFFVRSTDLLSLANVNPDSALAVQMSIEDSLADSSLACFQAALLYTSSKGKRRIRVHTLCLPVVTQLSEVYAGADVQAVTCLLANMAIDRSVSSGLLDARDALVNAVVDLVGAYRSSVSNLQQSGLVLPSSMRLFPLYILALLKQKALRTGTSTRLDERVFAMCQFKTEPLPQLLRMLHPDLYRLDTISDQGALHLNDTIVPQPLLLHLSAERLSRDGAFLLDCGSVLYLWVGRSCSDMFLRDVLGVSDHASLPPSMNHIPELDTPLSERVRAFLDWLQENRSSSCPLHIIRDDALAKTTFFQHLVEDSSESGLSYYDFLQQVLQQVSK
ncbi:protein transport protein Sec24B [Periophthalmus magnuspinnatus]|uniref:protein transport protein Sec24B n=1 Tax=Periophthalmus magnuspinnatus TaxID=409849 RepID=UPI00145B67B9|nr:protein transport protein Sec24B [Periophthalmus magnuspinnatus]